MISITGLIGSGSKVNQASFVTQGRSYGGQSKSWQKPHRVERGNMAEAKRYYPRNLCLPFAEPYEIGIDLDPLWLEKLDSFLAEMANKNES